MTEQSILAHFTYNLANAVVRNWPFPHLFYENVFPEDFYADLVKSIPDFSEYAPISKVRKVSSKGNSVPFPDRFVITLNPEQNSMGTHWDTASAILRSEQTCMTLLDKFKETVQPRLIERPLVEPDALLIRDRTNYVLGPHTDIPRRLAVLIIYLPETEDNPHLGTSLYVPKDKGRSCEGTQHYRHEYFNRVYTAPYKPNSALAFVKTNNSFHGVEPVLEGEERNIIHYVARFANG